MSNHLDIDIAFIVGHSPENMGAYSEYLKLHEFEYYTEWVREYLLPVCRGEGIKALVYERESGESKTDLYKRALASNPLATIELHFNSFHNESARGTEVLRVEDPDKHETGVNHQEMRLSSLLCRNITKALGTKDRGVKNLEEKDRGYYNLSRSYDIPTVIIEPAFGSNDKDASKLLFYKYNFALAIVRAVQDWIEEFIEVLNKNKGEKEMTEPTTETEVTKPYSFEKLKEVGLEEGLELSEIAAYKFWGIFTKWLHESAKQTPNVLDDFLKLATSTVDPFVESFIDKIDRKENLKALKLKISADRSHQDVEIPVEKPGPVGA